MIAILGSLAIVAAMVAIGVVVDRALRPALPAPQDGRGNVTVHKSRPAGDTAATAIRASAAQRAKLRTSQRCRACRELQVDEGNDDPVRLGDRELIALHFRCPKCGNKRVLYVEPTA